MFLKWITNCLLFLTLIYLTHTDAENDFRATEGETVYLPCHSPPIDRVQVSVEWTKHSTSSTTICQWNINNITGSHTGDCVPRFKFNRKSFTLSIENVQPSDSGHYSCKTSRLIPPPILENTTNVTLQVEVRPHLSLQKLNSSNVTCIHLLCSMEGLTTELVNFTWSREGQSSLHPFKSYATNSELRLCKPDWSDGDTITCYASYSSTQTQRSIQLTSQKDSDKELEQNFPVVCMAIFSFFIICIVFIWILFCVSKHKTSN
ncbi:uncharacterized protein LOC107747053 [Sinocyclocheilus rhinocerous]|uniref:uncharacterized protein LOC107747053 n=1 Tax=Sinocyclocheilus rhinocerous TaxID=307959 RepID=UPI0007B9DF00|nr:PREDICTED: uncharacterized protein LOC107747053 [Sinocyclocheilus rhinocerous]